jgi:hypothetical protein
MDTIITHLITYWQPLSGLLLGVAILILVGYIQFFSNIRTRVVKCIAKHIYRDKFMSEKSAESLFMAITSFAVPVAAIFILSAILYLTN